ncbi:MAG: hypothetical protein ACI4LM_00290 [Anaerovoracaceae bacterium]|jgi:hypothetical protein
MEEKTSRKSAGSPKNVWLTAAAAALIYPVCRLIRRFFMYEASAPHSIYYLAAGAAAAAAVFLIFCVTCVLKAAENM